MVKVFNQQFKKGQGDVQEVDEDITLGSEDFFVPVDATNGPVTVTLLRADGWGGKRFCIIKLDNSANAVTVVPVTGQTINAGPSKIITGQFGVIEVISDGENYSVVTDVKGDAQFINMKVVGVALNINAGSEIPFELVSSSGLSVVVGRVTLKAGVTYVLQASLRHDGPGGNTAANYIWRDYTNAVNLGVGNQIDSMDSLTDDGSQPTMMVVIKPITDIDVGVICTATSTPNVGVQPDATQATIHSI